MLVVIDFLRMTPTHPSYSFNEFGFTHSARLAIVNPTPGACVAVDRMYSGSTVTASVESALQIS